MLHQSSLMLDDIEDDSTLRRGKPTAHTLFGTAQTINSANWVFVCAFEELRQLRGVDAATVFVEELKNLHCGQALDLHWKHHTYIPSVDEYLNMVDHKTGGLFRLCVRLMQGESSTSCHHIDAERFITLLGRYFQIRDDYQNLVSDEVRLHTNLGYHEDMPNLPIVYQPERLLRGSRRGQDLIAAHLLSRRFRSHADHDKGYLATQENWRDAIEHEEADLGEDEVRGCLECDDLAAQRPAR